jgi:hypothetical protein
VTESVITIRRRVRTLSVNVPNNSTPLTLLATTPTVTILIKPLNKPSVRKLIGNVRNLIIGMTVKLSRVRKMMNINAAVRLLTSKLGSILDSAKIAIILERK